jgi:hypothetical protein
MAPSKLRELLNELHAKLSEREPGAVQDRELIREVMGDLKRLLSDDTAVRSASHPSVFAKQAVRLESSHPDLIPIVRQIVEILGQAGV